MPELMPRAAWVHYANHGTVKEKSNCRLRRISLGAGNKKAVLLGWGEDAAPPHFRGYGSLGRVSVPSGKINREPSIPGKSTS
jgi:hypothetical protein